MVIANALWNGNCLHRRVNGRPEEVGESNDIHGMKARFPARVLVRIVASTTPCFSLLMIILVLLQSSASKFTFRMRLIRDPTLTVRLWMGIPGRSSVLRYSCGMLTSGIPTSWNAESALRYIFGSPGIRSMTVSLTALTSTLRGVRITRSLKYFRM
jgi:hypothetical protein